jgi:hypothetical protein
MTRSFVGAILGIQVGEQREELWHWRFDPGGYFLVELRAWRRKRASLQLYEREQIVFFRGLLCEKNLYPVMGDDNNKEWLG